MRLPLVIKAAENRQAHLRSLDCHRIICKVLVASLTITTFLTLNLFSSWTSIFSHNASTLTRQNRANSDSITSLSKLATEIMPQFRVPERFQAITTINKADGVVLKDDFWQFEITERLYDNRTDIPTKVVLLWTPFFGNWSDHFALNHGPYVELDIYNSSKRCYFTRDRLYLQSASALLFHGRDLDVSDLPQRRLPWQRWIFYLHESPLHSGFAGTQWTHVSAMQFNWTMSYAKAANVYFPYGHIRRSKRNVDMQAMDAKIAGFAKSFKSRPTDAVWIVSNCYTLSKRQDYANKLKELGITLDIFGSCGGRKPDKEWQKMGEKSFFMRYRFVFGFENSLCDDYITEKAFHAFYANYIAGPIPVVYGGGNYSDFFLDGSYINVRSFRNISDLVSLMKSLSNADENSPELLNYYNWHKIVNPSYSAGYELEKFSDIYALLYSKRPGWRNLCKQLWDQDTGTNEAPVRNFTSSYVRDVRTQLGKCTSPDLSPLGIRE